MNDFPGIRQDDPKNIFFLLGQALHTCQSFEHTIQVTVSVLSNLGVEGISADKAKEILDGKSPKPLGQLLEMISKMVTLNKEGEDLVGKALAARNRIIHRIIREFSEQMNTRIGRMQFANELKRLDKVIIWVRDFFIEALNEISKLYGTKTDPETAD